MPLLRCASLLVLSLTLGPEAAPAPRPVPPPAGAAAQDEAAQKLAAAFAEAGIRLDLAHGLCSIPAEVLVRGDLLEYLIVNPRGAAHESAFLTEVPASRLNAALLALGAQPGTNARRKRKDPPPSQEDLRQGAPAYDVLPPEGDGFYLYAAWKVDGETHFHRMEDLVLDLRVGQTMRRHKWVYLGSRMLRLRADKPEESFAADLEGNLVNIAFFDAGNTLLTAALPECLDQTVWQANYWLLPERGSPVELVFARERLAVAPPEVEARLRDAQRVKPADER
jgi:hypothetical protein